MAGVALSSPFAFSAPAPPEVDQFVKILAAFVPPMEAFVDAPLVLKLLHPLTYTAAPWSQAAWHIAMLLALAGATTAITAAAAHIESEAENTQVLVWASTCFAPIFLTLWLGQLGLVFGLLPLAAGYLLLTKGKPALAGFVWSILLLKPAFLIVAAVNVIAQILAGKFRCLAGLIMGLVLVVLITWCFCGAGELNGWLSQFLQFSLQPQADPRLDISFTNSVLFFGPDKRVALAPLCCMTSLVIALGGLVQLRTLAKTEGKGDELIPLSTLVGTLLVPIVSPHLPFCDLSVLMMVALIAFCIERREHMEFRIQTLARLSWLAVNGYALLFYFNRTLAYPIEIIFVILILYLRLCETVNYTAHTPNF
jgi:hypothetical protein